MVSFNLPSNALMVASISITFSMLLCLLVVWCRDLPYFLYSPPAHLTPCQVVVLLHICQTICFYICFIGFSPLLFILSHCFPFPFAVLKRVGEGGDNHLLCSVFHLV